MTKNFLVIESQTSTRNVLSQIIIIFKLSSKLLSTNIFIGSRENEENMNMKKKKSAIKLFIQQMFYPSII